MRTIEVHGAEAQAAVPNAHHSVRLVEVNDTGVKPAGTGPPAGPGTPVVAGEVVLAGTVANIEDGLVGEEAAGDVDVALMGGAEALCAEQAAAMSAIAQASPANPPLRRE